MSLLAADSISKRFGGIAAVSGVSLAVEEDEIVGLVGPNGAGKTTLFNCISGMLRPDAGRVFFGGDDVTRLPTYRRARLGMGRTFQRVEVFPGMSVREHLLIAERARRGRGSLLADLAGRSGWTAAEQEQAIEALALVGLVEMSERAAETLSLGHARLLELARAIMGAPVLLLLDEPSSGLDRQEAAALAEVLRHVHRDRGIAILIVEHDLDLVRGVAGRLAVLDLGRLIAVGATEDVLADPTVRRAYLGAGS